VSTRAIPLQARSRERLERMLRAAGEILDDAGLEGLTMEQVARQAETSIGSVYRYYASRDELVVALARSVGAAGLAAMADLYTPESARRSADEIAEDYVRRHRAFLAEQPGARGLIASRAALAGTLHRSSRVEVEWRGRVERFISDHAPGLPAKRIPSAAAMLMQATDAGVVLALSAPPREQAGLFAELQALVASYLASLR
jgi:AcrR family transcriptional regulator